MKTSLIHCHSYSVAHRILCEMFCTLVCILEVKDFEHFFHVVLLIISLLYKMVLSFTSVDVTLVCDHSSESYRTVLSCGTVYYAVQGGSNF